MKKDKSNNDPWLNNPSPDELIGIRPRVEKLDENVVREFLDTFTYYIKEKDHAGIYSLFSIDLEAVLLDYDGVKIRPFNCNRDACCYSFSTYIDTSDIDKYKVEVCGLKEIENNEFDVTLVVSGFGNEKVESLYGSEATFKARVVLYNNIPVLSKFIYNNKKS